VSVVQIAAQAGVSIATVSRVLNNSRRVNPRLADQVHRAMQDLNLNPNQIRRRAPNKRAGDVRGATTIAIVGVGRRYRGWFEIPVIASVLAAITRCALEHEVGTLIAELAEPGDMSGLLRRQQINGALVFLDSSMSPGECVGLSQQLPIVRVMGGQMSSLEFDHVAPDNPAIGYLGCQALLQQGCQELAYLTTRPAWDFSMLRGQGFAAAALAAGRRPRAFIESDSKELDCVYGANLVALPDLASLVSKLADAIRKREGSAPFGVFVSRDEETVTVYRLLAELGIQIGQDVLVVSCDNEQVRLAGLRPKPVSIDLNAADIAQHAIERLLLRIEGPPGSPLRMLINPKLPGVVAAPQGEIL
jgi:DNA-binding LacI/PurR family transcriptional regulator